MKSGTDGRTNLRRRDVTIGGVATVGSLLGGAARAGGRSAMNENVAETIFGKVQGARVNGVVAFKGVPYGGATRARRFRPAAAPVPWRGVRKTTAYGPQCPQAPFRAPVGPLNPWPSSLDESEDCLTLNIWTRGLRDSGKRPVMVWLHGGGFSSWSGSSPGYDGTALAAKHDVVLVAVTHRLNAFGHLYLAELGGEAFQDSGNVGMLDIVQALAWVRDNIAEFGGDPQNVTVFGQSGGAGKVTTLMAMPAAQGLFHRAICQSGSTCIGQRSTASATREALAFMSEVGLAPGQVEQLHALPIEQMRRGARRDWRPVVDGRNLIERPFFPHAPAGSSRVPLLIGTAKDEYRWHMGVTDPDAFSTDWDGLLQRLGKALPRDPKPIVAFYRDRYPQASPGDLLAKIVTAWRWRYSALWQADRKVEQGGAPVFAYRMDWETQVEDGRWKALHTIEIPFVFDNLAGSQRLVGAGGDLQALADQMSSAWVAFARTGNPQTPLAPVWSAYEPAARSTMCFNSKTTLLHDPDAEERALFAGLTPAMPD